MELSKNGAATAFIGEWIIFALGFGAMFMVFDPNTAPHNLWLCGATWVLVCIAWEIRIAISAIARQVADVRDAAAATNQKTNAPAAPIAKTPTSMLHNE